MYVILHFVAVPIECAALVWLGIWSRVGEGWESEQTANLISGKRAGGGTNEPGISSSHRRGTGPSHGRVIGEYRAMGGAGAGVSSGAEERTKDCFTEWN